MRHWVISLLLCPPTLLLTGGCLSVGEGLSTANPRASIDHYQLLEKSASSSSGCQFDYRVYRPVMPATGTSLIIGHGFLRDQDTMVGLSRALANLGVQVVTLDFCNMRPWNGHHQKNAQDMRDLAQALDIDEDIIFAGFSAGALAAILASDNNTRAILTLDLVDQANLGLTSIGNLQTPLVGLAGRASSCNANNNGKALFDARLSDHGTVSQLVEVADASHCDFESPTNWLCEISCGNDSDTRDAKTRRAGIIDETVKMVLPYLSEINSSVSNHVSH